MLSGGSESNDEFSYTVYSKQKTAAVGYSSEATNLQEARLKIVAAQEVERYLVEIDDKTDERLDPLEWWCSNRCRYPNVARAEQKWLYVSGTSTPSERVFSICGIVDTVNIPECLVNQLRIKFLCITTTRNA